MIDLTGSGDIPNSDGGVAGDLFGWALPSGTGAPGSGGATVADELPDRDWRVPAVGPYDSVQSGDVNLTGVGRDDVNLANQSQTYSTGQDPLTGLVADFLGQTGAGQGSPQMSHPNSQARRP